MNVFPEKLSQSARAPRHLARRAISLLAAPVVVLSACQSAAPLPPSVAPDISSTVAAAVQATVQAQEAARTPVSIDTTSRMASPRPPPALPALFLDETFANLPQGWPNVLGGPAHYADGAYQLAAGALDHFVAINAPLPTTTQELVLSGRFHKSGGPSGGGYGLLVRDQGSVVHDGLNQGGQFVVLEVNDLGSVGVWQREQDQWIDLMPWTLDAAVHGGSATNDLTVRTQGKELTFLVNGAQVAQVSTELMPGGVGVFVGGDGNQVVLDRFAIGSSVSGATGPAWPAQLVSTPTSTVVHAVATAVPAVMSTQTPDAAFGRQYFGQVTLATVPDHDSDAPAATQFFYQSQIALNIEGLKQRARFPFSMRVFNIDSAALVAEVQSGDTVSVAPAQLPWPSAETGLPNATPVTVGAVSSAAIGLNAPSPLGKSVNRQHDDGLWYQETQLPNGERVVNGLAPVLTAANDGSVPHVTPARISYFWDTYVWYHTGGDLPGRYRVELYGNGVLTDTFDYTVGSAPAPGPSPTLATVVDPTPTPPADVAAPRPVSLPVSRPQSVLSGPVAPVATLAPTDVPTATPIPTPATADTTVLGGAPAGLDINSTTGRFYLADGSGFIWSADAPTGQERPTLRVPINLPAYGAGFPVDLAVDPNTDFLFLSMRVCPSDGQAVRLPLGCIVVVNGQTQQIQSVISLPGAPGDLRLDPELGLLYVVIPDLQLIAQVSIREDGLPASPVVDSRGVSLRRVMRTIDRMPNITSIALDPVRHTLYASSLVGELAVIDVPTGELRARVPVTGAGLTGVSTARGLAYAINTATHELAVLEPVSQAVNRYVLSQEPAAVAAGEDSGAVYVLSSRADLILRIDPSDGHELGRVNVVDRAAHVAIRPSDLQGLRPRVVLNQTDHSIYATFPESGTLAAITDISFPPIAREIPFPNSPEEILTADIPNAVWPAAVKPELARGN